MTCNSLLSVSVVARTVSPAPVSSAYAATKSALEALSDGLRLELAPFGVKVIVIEPGPIKTQFEATAQVHAQQTLAVPDSPYRPLYQKSEAFAASLRQDDQGPEVVSQVIQQAIENSKPKARYLAGVDFAGRLALVLRDVLWDSILQRSFKFVP